MPGPLEGLKVVEMARILAGPWAGQTLSDLGCDVIKVESPAGDDTRQWGPPFVTRDDDVSASYFHSTNRGKASVTIERVRARSCVRRACLCACMPVCSVLVCACK